MLQGAPYCSACWPVYAKLAASTRLSEETRLPEQTRLPQQTRVVATHGPAFPHPERASGPSGCDCCGRELETNPRMIEGFWLCAACHGQDVALALKIAKARHQRRLQELALQFERSTNDGK